MGWIDTPLTDEGKQNARSSAVKLRGEQIDQIVSSDLGRAFTSAYIIARELGYSQEIETSKGLREMSYGDLANQPYDSIPQLAPEIFVNYIPPNGESLSQMQARVLDCIDKLAQKYEGKTVLLVAHDGVINAVRAKYAQHDMAHEDETHNPHDFVAKFEWDNGQIRSFEEVTSNNKRP